MKEILTKEELTTLIKETVNEVSDAVCTTYGPNGNTVILSDFEGNGIVTKDGVSVSNAINFENPYKNIINNILKQVAQKTVDEAGDGTTTSICLTQAFVNKGYELLENGVGYNDIKSSLEDLLEYTIDKLIEGSKSVKKKDIINVARTASNNDMKIAEIINRAYEHSSVVKVEESTLSTDSLININGVHLKAGYFNQAFINNNKSRSIEYDDCYVALIDGEMHRLEVISGLVNLLDNKPLIIIADNFTDRVVNSLKEGFNNGIKIALIKAPGVNNHRRNILEDISIYTSAVLLSPDKKYSMKHYLGTLSGIEIKKEESILYKKNIPNAVKERLDEFKTLLKRDINEYDKELLQQRLESLGGSASIIKVGGESPVEMKERYDRYEDAVLAVKHAIKDGYVKGGGIALADIANDIVFTKTPILELSMCLFACTNKLMIRDVHETVIDPLKVVRSALENAISVAKTLLSTDAIVLNRYLWKE